MRIPAVFRFGIVVCMFLAVGGCNLPASGEPQVAPEAVYTAAAQTIVAGLTAQPIQPFTTPPAGVGGTTEPPTATGTPTETSQPLPTETVTPSVTPNPSSTEIATSSAAASPTTQAADPKAALGDPEWRDDFSTGRNWSLYEDDHVQFEIEDGGLRMRAREPEGFDAWMITSPRPQDFYLEMSALTQDCSELDRYGVIFRSDASEGYLFGFSCDGRYALRIWDGEEFTELIDWTTSAHILTGAGQTNRLGVLVDGERFALYANGIFLEETTDDTYADGRFGVFVASENTEDFDVLVDEIAYWDLNN